MTVNESVLIEENLISVLEEIENQKNLSMYDLEGRMPLVDQLNKIREYVDIAGEYGLAYELLVVILERVPYVMRGPIVIKLIELALLMKFKTERDQDRIYDFR